MKSGANIEITPDSKLGELIDHNPQLEEVLISLSPAFRKLRNPVLRRTVAKVATLRQVARVGNISLALLINELRKATGRETVVNTGDEETMTDHPPDWFSGEAVEKTFDARPIIEAGRNPMKDFFAFMETIPNGRIGLLVTSFQPAPLIGIARGKNYEAWTVREAEELYNTYFTRIAKRENDIND